MKWTKRREYFGILSTYAIIIIIIIMVLRFCGRIVIVFTLFFFLATRFSQYIPPQSGRAIRTTIKPVSRFTGQDKLHLRATLRLLIATTIASVLRLKH